MKTRIFYSIKGHLTIVAVALILISFKATVKKNQKTTGLLTKNSLAISQTLSAGGSLQKVGYLTLRAVETINYSAFKILKFIFFTIIYKQEFAASKILNCAILKLLLLMQNGYLNTHENKI